MVEPFVLAIVRRPCQVIVAAPGALIKELSAVGLGRPPPGWPAQPPVGRMWGMHRFFQVGALVLIPLVLLVAWTWSLWVVDRFDHHAVRADAKIIGSDLGCLGAYGSPGSGAGSITYQIEFPYAGGNHATKVRRPCDVTPPDFGRGRGYIWIEYDVDHPDRVRVVNDDTQRERAQWRRQLLITVLTAEGVLLLWRWRSRLEVSGRPPAAPPPPPPRCR